MFSFLLNLLRLLLILLLRLPPTNEYFKSIVGEISDFFVSYSSPHKTSACGQLVSCFGRKVLWDHHQLQQKEEIDETKRQVSFFPLTPFEGIDFDLDIEISTDTMAVP